MSRPELSLGELPEMRLGRLPVMEPSPDLWERIAAAQRTRARRRRRLRHAATLCAALVGVLVLFASADRFGAFDEHDSATAIDWQARAQALELQLRALRTGASPQQGSDALATDLQNELALVDAALQTAYDDGATHDRVDALWKRRSELLSVLLAARRHDIRISRI
jgi:hypothetical protein